MTTVNEVVDFWLDEVGADRWYAADEALDHEVRRRFEQLWWDTLNGARGTQRRPRKWSHESPDKPH